MPMVLPGPSGCGSSYLEEVISKLSSISLVGVCCVVLVAGMCNQIVYNQLCGVLGMPGINCGNAKALLTVCGLKC